MISIQRTAADLAHLLFPVVCSACGLTLHQGEKAICTHCINDLPYTDFHLYSANQVAKQFWGRIPCDAAMAMLYFKRGSKTQHLIHHLKYEGKTELGEILGGLLGERLKLSNQYKAIDTIIPVPLHAKKERSRGYNQCQHIANGLANSLRLSVSNDILLRKKQTSSQTSKSRYTRYENIQSVFQVNSAESIQNKHILLVDDVITTGATLEGCGNSLFNSGIRKLSIVALAFTK